MSIITIEDIKALNELKNQIFVDYNSIIDEQNKVELFNSFKSVKECKKILENIYSRMCENFNINNNAKINMNFCDLFETINNFDIDKSTIELGYYKNDEININLIVNCTALNLENYNVTQINNNSISKYSKNWAVTLLDVFLHESYHSIQEQTEFEESQWKSLNFNELSTPAKQYRVDSFIGNKYNKNNNLDLYVCKIMEIGARKFALNEIWNLYNTEKIENIDIKNQIEEYLNDAVITEIKNVYSNKEEILLNARRHYLVIAKNFEFEPFIENFYNEQFEYYKNLDYICNKLIKNIHKKLNIENLNLKTEEKFNLYNDYINYSKSSNKQEYLNNIKNFNHYLKNNKCSAYCSKLINYLELNKSKNLDI